MKFENFMYGMNPYMANNMPCDYAHQNDLVSGMALAYSYVPYQTSGKLYSECDALLNGTVFHDLNKPLNVYGLEFCACDNSAERNECDG